MPTRRTTKKTAPKSPFSYAVSIAQKDRQPQKTTGTLDHFPCSCAFLSSISPRTTSPYFWIILARNSAHFSMFSLAYFSVSLPVSISSIFPIAKNHLLLFQGVLVPDFLTFRTKKINPLPSTDFSANSNRFPPMHLFTLSSVQYHRSYGFPRTLFVSGAFSILFSASSLVANSL